MTERAPELDQPALFVLTPEHIAMMTDALEELVREASITSALLIDRSGGVVASFGATAKLNTAALGALLAGAYQSSLEIARLINEPDVQALYQQGAREQVYNVPVGDQWLLTAIFSPSAAVGGVRVAAEEISRGLQDTLADMQSATHLRLQKLVNPELRASVGDTIDLLFKD